MDKLGKRPPLNTPDNGDAFSMMLEAMSVDELTDALNNALENMTEENYDPAWIDAYLAALDRKDPMPEIPDAEASYASFQKRIQRILPERKEPRRRLRHVWRVGLAAVLTIICMLGGMVVAQAAGWDVFGAMGRWSEEVFSFGAIRSDGAVDVPDVDADGEFTSLQAALDTYGITEVSEPTWIPEGYAFKSVTVDYWPNGDIMRLLAEYYNGTRCFFIQIKSYQNKPSMQVEKTDAPVETYAVNDTTVYLLENINNNSAVWVTEHYECLIGGSVEKSELQQMVLSTYTNS